MDKDNTKAELLPLAGRAEDRALYHMSQNAMNQGVLAEIDRLRTELDMLKAAQPELWSAVLGKLKVQWTTDSNAIEGSTLTFGETLFFLQHGLTVEGKPFKDHLDARNHAEAIELLFDVITKRRPLSEGLIKEVNAIIMSGVHATPAVDQFGQRVAKPATPGDYKANPNHVVQTDGTIHRYVEPLQVASQMQTLVNWINDALDIEHPVTVAAIAHYNFVRIHPFDDGNGRGARILMNLILMKQSFPPTVIASTGRFAYIQALSDADRGRLEPFVNLIAAETRTTLANLVASLKPTREGS